MVYSLMLGWEYRSFGDGFAAARVEETYWRKEGEVCREIRGRGIEWWWGRLRFVVWVLVDVILVDCGFCDLVLMVDLVGESLFVV